MIKLKHVDKQSSPSFLLFAILKKQNTPGQAETAAERVLFLFIAIPFEKHIGSRSEEHPAFVP